MSEQVKKVLADRQDTYGDAMANFEAIGRSWSDLFGCEKIPPYKVGIAMIQLKIRRIIVNPFHADSWDDLEGYIHHVRTILNATKPPIPPEIDD